jgi:hypothetical protein
MVMFEIWSWYVVSSPREVMQNARPLERLSDIPTYARQNKFRVKLNATGRDNLTALRIEGNNRC